ncbi:MAG TPA: hypothetical protein VF611_12760 [Pyrinomonadaceae bacterium]|jgi:hypothetical protein
MPEKKLIAHGAVQLLIAFAVLAAAVSFTACPPISEAEAKVLSMNAESDMGLVDGEPDYGFTVTLVIKNVGKTDPIRIRPRLSCSEGEWERTQTLTFSAGETKTLKYFFSEPTVNATNCHYGGWVWPKASE